jgi:uncharacterized protein with GYD domain
MPLFIRLASLTDKGSKQVRDLTDMLSGVKKTLEAQGARIVQAYVTLGRYDLVAVIEAPDAKTAAKASALIAEQGNFKAETLMAIPVQEFTEEFGS